MRKWFKKLLLGVVGLIAIISLTGVLYAGAPFPPSPPYPWPSGNTNGGGG